MSEELEARQIVKDGKTISTVKLSDRDVLRDMDHCGCCVCECRECVTSDVHQHGRDSARAECEADCGMSTGAGASSSPTTSTARRQANLQYTNLRFRQSIHRPCTSKHIKKRKLRKPLLTINPKVKNITKQITTKYLQKFKRFVLIQNPDAKRSLFKTNRKIKQLFSLTGNHPRRMRKYNLGGTGARLGLVTSINVSVSSSNTTITVHSRKRQEAHANNRTKLIATNLFSKLMFYLKSFFVMKRKSQSTKKLNRKKHTCYEPPSVTLNYIYPYQSNSSHTLDGINKMKWDRQSSVLNAASDMSSISSSSIQSFNDQETQVSEPSVVQNPIINEETFLTNLSMCNVYSQRMLRRNDLLIQNRNKNGKMIIKKSRRVMFRGHHNRFMTRTYRQSFNKTYHTFLAEIDYTNQPLQPCQNRQGVGIGSTWDVCIDFGRSQVLPRQSGADPGSGTFRNVGQGSRSKPYQCPPGDCVTGACDINECYKALSKQSSGKGDNGFSSTSKRSTLQPFQCPPGVCVPGACNSTACFKRLNKTAPYGSHVSTQSHKYKLRDQRAAREKTYGRKKSNMTSSRKIKRGRRGESRLAGNQIALTPAGLPYRQTVRIGSKCSFNVKLYKETPLGARSGQNYQGYTTVGRQAGRARKKKKPLKTFQCEPGICVPGKCSPSECLKQFKCEPKVCKPGKCDPSDCFRRQRGTVTETSFPSSSNGSSQVSTQSCRLKGRELRAGRETFCKEKGILSKPRSKPQLNMPYRQSVRIGSKCSFNVEFYKCCPQNALGEQDRGDTSDGRKDTAKRGKKFQCDPRVCALGKCNPNECFQKLRIQNTFTDASFTGSSKGSQASKKSLKKLRGETLPCYKDKYVPCMPRPKMPLHIGNRQAVRIGSKCSFNIEFYKCSPQNGSAMTPMNMSEPARPGKKRKPLKKFQCDPRICFSGKCDANECFQALQTKTTSGCDSSFTGSSRGSQATTKRRQDKTRVLKSGKATFYKDTGVSSLPCAKKSLHIPNRQTVRIGSTCSFNIEFYKCLPQNGLVTSQQDYQSAKSLPNKGKPKSLPNRGIFECEPGVCIPGKCNPSECFKQFECSPKVCVPGKCDPIDCMQRLRGTPTGTDGSYTGSSISTQSRKFKRGKIKAVDRTLYKEKGVSSVSRNKPTLRTPNRQAVRIGSNCSFNIEFYKAISPPMMGDQNYPPVDFNNQDDNGKKRGTLKKYECVPGACIPGKCVPVECYNRIKQSQISGQSDSSGGRKSEKKRKKFKKYECVPGACIPGKCVPVECYNRIKQSQISGQSDSSGGRKSGKKRKTLINYDCEPGVCIPGKCNVKECFQIFKAKRSIDNDGSLTDSSVATASQASKKRKRKSKRPELSARNAKFYTERGASSMPRSKTPLHLQNRQAVRIGSTCSFNMEFYKQIPANKRQHPFQYNIDESRKYPAFPSSSETSGGQSTGVTCKCMHELVGDKETPTGKKERTTGKKERTTEKKEKTTGKKERTTGKKERTTGNKERTTGKDERTTEKKERTTGKKERTTGKKERTTGKKERTTGKKERTTGKKERTTGKKERTAVKKDKTKQKYQPAGQQDQGDATLQDKSSSLPGGKSKGPKGKKTQEQGDATTKAKLSTGTQGQAPKRKRTKGKQSQTRVSDQQSETSVDEKVGTDKLIDQGVQGDTPVQRNVQSKKIGKASKEKTKYDQSDKEFEYELGVCIPNKCDPYLCFDRLRNRKEGTSTDGSLSTQSKLTGSTSKTTNVNLDRKVEADRRKTESSISPVYKNKGTSGIVTNKNSQDIPQRIPPLGTPGNKKQVVRIGSSCSFNVQIFKDKPLTPAQVASVRSASTPPPKPELPEIKKEKLDFASNVKQGRIYPKARAANRPGAATGTHGRWDFLWFWRDSLTSGAAKLIGPERQSSQYVKKWCCRMMGQPDFLECAGLLHESQTSQKCQCPARFICMDAGTNAYGNVRPAVQSCCANAATQSRRCPGLQQLSLNDNSLRTALCKCVAQLNPSRGTTGPRNVPYKSIVPGNWPFGPVPGYGDDFNRYQVREQAVVIGSGCGFNVNFFKRRK